MLEMKIYIFFATNLIENREVFNIFPTLVPLTTLKFSQDQSSD